MHAAHLFELIVAMLVAVSALYWIAERLGWPPSSSLLIGGAALAFIPGVPPVQLDPGLVLVLFLPPLLSDGAWNTEIARYRRRMVGILSLAVGAVLFSTLVVAVVTLAAALTLPTSFPACQQIRPAPVLVDARLRAVGDRVPECDQHARRIRPDHLDAAEEERGGGRQAIAAPVRRRPCDREGGGTRMVTGFRDVVHLP